MKDFNQMNEGNLESARSLLSRLLLAQHDANDFFSKYKVAGSSIMSCPLKDQNALISNLKLGGNEIYRDHILLAAQRTNIDPASIASIINAESAKLPNSDIWDPNSQSTSSSAKGLTQFLSGTWLEMAKTPGTLLNEECKKLNYIDKDNQIIRSKNSEILDLRTDAKLSIVTGAEYAKNNLDYLDGYDLIPENATDDEKAKLAYLAHHEGPGGARKFLLGELSEERSEDLLITQIGEDRATTLAEKTKSYKSAYRNWLNDYINRQIQPNLFRINSD